MQSLSICLLLAAAAGHTYAAPEDAPVSTDATTNTTTFESTFPPTSTAEYLAQQVAALKTCDQTATFAVTNGTDIRAAGDSPDFGEKCIVATISEDCYNQLGDIQGYDVWTVYPGDSTDPAEYCVEYTPAAA